MPDPVMGAEDFAYYGKHVSVLYKFIGVWPEGVDSYSGLHSSKYDFNDTAIAVAVRLMCCWGLDAEASGS